MHSTPKSNATLACTPHALRAQAFRLEAEAKRLHAEAEELAARTVDAPREWYTQHDRPSWAQSSNVFLRAWHALRDEGHVGVAARGKIRLMSREAADEYLARSSRCAPLAVVPPPASAARDLDAQVAAELGVRPRRAS